MKILTPIAFTECLAEKTLDFCGLDDPFFYFGSLFFVLPILIIYAVAWTAIAVPLAILWVPIGLIFHGGFHILRRRERSGRA